MLPFYFRTMFLPPAKLFPRTRLLPTESPLLLAYLLFYYSDPRPYLLSFSAARKVGFLFRTGLFSFLPIYYTKLEPWILQSRVCMRGSCLFLFAWPSSMQNHPSHSYRSIVQQLLQAFSLLSWFFPKPSSAYLLRLTAILVKFRFRNLLLVIPLFPPEPPSCRTYCIGFLTRLQSIPLSESRFHKLVFTWMFLTTAF